MSKRYAIFVAVAALTAGLGWVWAANSQQARPTSADGEMLRLQHKLELNMLLEEYGPDHPKVRAMKKRLELLDKALGELPPEHVGRFALAGSPQGTVKMDTKTGESWYLRAAKAGSDEMVWVPIKGETLPAPTPVGK